jgi:hypothetical protein
MRTTSRWLRMMAKKKQYIDQVWLESGGEVADCVIA